MVPLHAFLTADNEFVGEEDTLTVEEARAAPPPQRRRRPAAAVAAVVPRRCRCCLRLRTRTRS